MACHKVVKVLDKISRNVSWMCLVYLLSDACGFSLAEPDRNRRAASDITTAGTPSAADDGTFNKAYIIIPSIVVGIPILIFIFCVLKSCCSKCKCCEEKKPKVPKWIENRKQRSAATAAVSTKSAHPGDLGKNEQPNYAAAEYMQEYDGYPDHEYPPADMDYSEQQQQYDENGYSVEYAYGQYAEGAEGYYEEYGQGQGQGQDYQTDGYGQQVASEEPPSSAGSGSKLFPNRVSPEVQNVPKKKSKKSKRVKSHERY